MRTSTTLITLLLASAVVCQPTITQSHLPVAGHSYTTYNDTIGGAAFTATAPGGSSQTWDYTDVFTVHTTEERLFVPPAGLAGALLYPMSDLAITSTLGEYLINVFYNNEPDGLTLLGSYFGLTDVFSVTNTVVDGGQFPVPLTLGTVLTQNTISTTLIVYDAGLGLPAELQQFHTTGTITGDAYGTLSTPAWPGGVEVVRVRTQKMMEVDSTFTDATGTGNGPWVFVETNTSPVQAPSYDYFREGVPTFVMSVNNDQSYATYYGNSLTTGIATNDLDHTAQVYPNPSNGSVSIMVVGANATSLEIIDISGRVQATYSIKGVDRINVMTENWAGGTYTYRCLDSAGALVRHGKFLVAR